MDFAKRALYIGLGMASATKERVDSLADELGEQFSQNEEEGRKFAQKLKDESTKARSELRDNVNKLVDDALDRVPTLGRVRAIERRLEALENAVGIVPPAEEQDSEADGTDRQDAAPPDLSSPDFDAERQDQSRK